MAVLAEARAGRRFEYLGVDPRPAAEIDSGPEVAPLLDRVA